MFKLTSLSLVLALGWVGSAHSLPIVAADGREWLQPNQFANLSWNDVNLACDATSGGMCTGSFAGYDLTGWTWASVADVNALFDYYIGGAQPFAGYFQEINSAWAPAFFDDGWIETFAVCQANCTRYVFGWTRSLTDDGRGRYVYIVDDRYPTDETAYDIADTSSDYSTGFKREYLGAMFFRVPVPATLPLLGLGLAVLGLIRRQIKDNA